MAFAATAAKLLKDKKEKTMKKRSIASSGLSAIIKVTFYVKYILHILGFHKKKDLSALYHRLVKDPFFVNTLYI